jgi:hypothetical protein
MGFNGTTNGDTVGFHMKKEGYNDYTCIYIYIYIQPTWVAVGNIFQGVSLVKIPPKVGIVPPLTIMK